MINVLFVCLGNICRSSSAQGCLQKLINGEEIGAHFTIDSCGTAAFNTGKSPDPRAVAAAKRAGIDIGSQFARQINDDDFMTSDYIIAMDRMNLSSLRAWAPADCTCEIALLMDYTPHAANSQIADPFYERADAFDTLIHALQSSTRYLLDHIRLKHEI